MKVHEETWFVEADGPEVEVHRVGGSVCGLNGPHARTPEDLARATLIAQAPAMARLLLEAVAAPGDFDAWLKQAHETLIAAGLKPPL